MNSSQESPPPKTVSPPGPAPVESGPLDDWRTALTTLIASRVAMIRLEARQAARDNAGRAVRAVIAAFCLLFGWMLLLAGGIAAVAALGGWPWHWVALATAALHVLLAGLLFNSLKSAPPAFQATRAEFQRDREWIENFQKKPSSSA